MAAALWPASARLGWLTCRRPNPPPDSALGAAYFFRGQATVFSRGFGTLADRSRGAGWFAEDLRCVGDRWVVRHAIRARPRAVVLVGHSRGGRRALVAAARLGAAGVSVELVIGIDVAFPPTVPANVRRAVHLFRSRRRLYPARPLAENGATSVANVDLDAADAPVPPAGLHHLNITADNRVQEWVFDAIRACPDGERPA